MHDRKGKVLVIDDDLQYLSAADRALSCQGYDVVTASEALEGITLAATTKPSVVIVDTMMPELDGFEVTRRIRQLGSMSQVILATGFVEPIKIVDGYCAGATDYVLKPAGTEELLAAVERAAAAFERWCSLMISASRERVRGVPA